MQPNMQFYLVHVEFVMPKGADNNKREQEKESISIKLH